MISDGNDDSANNTNLQNFDGTSLESPLINSPTAHNEDSMTNIPEATRFEEIVTNNEPHKRSAEQIDYFGPMKLRMTANFRTMYNDFEFLERKLQEETNEKNQAVKELNELKNQLEAEKQKVEQLERGANGINEKEAEFQKKLEALNDELKKEKKQTQKYRAAYMQFEKIMNQNNDETH